MRVREEIRQIFWLLTPTIILNEKKKLSEKKNYLKIKNSFIIFILIAVEK